MKQNTDDLYGQTTDQEVCRTGLFAEPGPFDGSTAERDRVTERVGDIIWRHKGRANPISVGTLCDKVGKFDREIKAIVEELIMVHHILIGANREPGRHGYFIVVDAEDFKVACGAYEKQIETMQKKMMHLRGLASAAGVLR